MKSHWIKRIVRLLVLLFGVSILCFILTALSSTDPATYLVRRGNLSPTPEVIEQVRAELGLDQPLPIRYLNWIGGVFRGDFGESIFSTNEVAADLAAYFPQTLQLVFLSLAEIIVFSILLGVLCAAKKNKLTDHIMRIVSLFGICVPPFWLGFLLLIGFAVEIPIFSVTPASGIMGLILPSITLSFPVICSTVRVFRASLLEEMHRDYVSFARANGMTVNRILWKKVFRNALPPVITLFCQYVSYLIAGSAVVEKVFSIKGVGNYLMNCINHRCLLTTKGQVDEILHAGEIQLFSHCLKLRKLAHSKAVQPLCQIVQLINVDFGAYQPIQHRPGTVERVQAAVGFRGIADLQCLQQRNAVVVLISGNRKRNRRNTVFRVVGVAQNCFHHHIASPYFLQNSKSHLRTWPEAERRQSGGTPHL